MFMGFRKNFGGGGAGGAGEEPEVPQGGVSNRQKKLEKRGGQKVVYR